MKISNIIQTLSLAHLMLSSDMNLNIRSETVGYNNKILVSDSRFSLGKNEKVNSLETPAMKSLTMESHKNSAHSTTTQGVSTKTSYCSRRGKSCFDSLSHWGLLLFGSRFVEQVITILYNTSLNKL